MKATMGSSYFESENPAEYLEDEIQINKNTAAPLPKRKKIVFVTPP